MRWFVTALLLPALPWGPGPSAVQAQTPAHLSCPPALLEQTRAGADRLRRGEGASGLIVLAFREGGTDVAGRARPGCRSRMTDAERARLLDRIEAVARGEVRGDVVGDELRRSRAVREAFATLRVIGLDLASTVPEAGMIPGRVLRLYRESPGRASKALAVGLLGDLLALDPPEAPEIIEILTEVASRPVGSTVGRPSPAPAPGAVHPDDAIRALLRACDVGLPVLRRLHEHRLVKAPMTAEWLRHLAEQGFTREQMEAERFGRPCP